MRRVLMLAVCAAICLAGCEKSATTSGQDSEKAQPRRMMKPGDGGAVPPPPHK